uniref:Uncharacterized protein n=1 Tax=Solanum lycopersicum TaxID=4081 RepID=K4BE32_SOLLC
MILLFEALSQVSGISNSLTLMLNTLKNYEQISGQLVNMNKYCYLVAPNTYADTN